MDFGTITREAFDRGVGYAPAKLDPDSRAGTRVTTVTGRMTGAVWGAGRLPLNAEHAIIVSEPPPADKENVRQHPDVQAAIAEVRAFVSRRHPEALADFAVEELRHADGADPVDLVVMVLQMRGLDRRARHQLNEELLDHLAASTSRTVRQHVTLTIR